MKNYVVVELRWNRYCKEMECEDIYASLDKAEAVRFLNASMKYYDMTTSGVILEEREVV